jgi:hypothetical protein
MVRRPVIRGGCGDPEPGYEAPGKVSPPRVHDEASPFPSQGPWRSRFPCISGTMEMCDILRPSRRTRLPSSGNTMRCGLYFRSRRSRSHDCGPGVRHRSPLPVVRRMEAFRTSQVPGEPSCSYAVFSDPGRTDVSGAWTSSARPPLCPQRRLPRHPFFRGSMARPWNSLCTLRAAGCPSHTQHSLPAAGQLCRAGLVTRWVPRKVSA